MSKFCSSMFWDSDLSWNIPSDPDLTPCFQDTILVWVPCAFIWILSLPQIITWKTRKDKKYIRIQWTSDCVEKIVISGLLTILSAIELVVFFVNLILIENDLLLYPVEFWTPFIKLITFFLATYLIINHRQNGRHTSGVLFIFWFLITISFSIKFRSILINFNESDFKSNTQFIKTAIRIICFPLVFIQLCLSCSTDNFLISDSKNPEACSSFLSRLTFWWFNSMIIKGYKSPLTSSDMWDLREENTSKVIVKRFEKNLNAVQEKQHNILFQLMKTFWSELLPVNIFKLFATLLMFITPIVLEILLSFLKNYSNEPTWRGYLYLSLIFLTLILVSLLNNQHDYGIKLIGMKVRACLISAIYKKSLKISFSAEKDLTAGKIMNLMSVDVQNMMNFIEHMSIMWASPIQVFISIYLLWLQIGVASISGLLVIFFIFPISVYIINKIKSNQKILMSVKDKRIKFLNGILSGIKTLKLLAWENSFKKKIDNLREEEISSLTSLVYCLEAYNFVFCIAPFMISLISFATFVLIDSENVLDANKAFVSLVLLGYINSSMFLFPDVLIKLSSFMISLRRINKYLSAKEVDKIAITRFENTKTPILVDSASFSWSRNDVPIIENISLQVKKNQLVAVVGMVGCGKSSLLSALLGDMDKLKGTVNICGSIAYVPQEPWIQNGTLRQSILFTKKQVNENERKYKKVLEACALLSDLNTFPSGDLTEIGENGINLSGGQKQRVSLARAVYQDCDIYLLDDPLSAVDTHVGQHIFDQVIGPNGLLKDKTRILVTHRLSVLPHVDEIILLKDGIISERGTYLELLQSQASFSNFIGEQKKMEHTEDSDENKNKNEIVGREVLEVKDNVVKEEGLECVNGKLISDENVETGLVKRQVFWKYITSMGVREVSLGLTFLFISNLFNVGYKLWLSDWSKDANVSNNTSNLDLRLGVYAALGISEAIFSFVWRLFISLACLNASRLIHNKMLNRIIRSSMSFFDTTPIGRIINRFSLDINITDTLLPSNLAKLLSNIFRVITGIAIISLESVYIPITMIPIIIAYIFIQIVYIATSKQLKRIDSVSRSNIHNHFSETISGVSSIRAFDAQKRFIREFNERVDFNHIHYHPSFVAMSWLALRSEILGAIIILIVGFFAIFKRDTIHAGLAGLVISFALEITLSLKLVINFATELETNVVSVERCLQYTSIPIEARWKSSLFTRPSILWPIKGEIYFHNYSTRYRDGLDLILKQVTFKVNSREKVGIVGRTGAGKSSLTLALFRIIEAVSGNIFIDNVDISQIGLHDLRSRLTIIPQNPLLFAGTLRINLDPFDQHTDEDIWDALESAHLKMFVKSLDKELQYEMSESGNNLSVGQKQLVCLTRALLSKTRILVLDEATAAVDMKTDELIQDTINKQFNDCTVLTIAHRINTILHYDRVLVLDDGNVVEYDSPQSLINDNQSAFYSLAKDAGIVP